VYKNDIHNSCRTFLLLNCIHVI